MNNRPPGPPAGLPARPARPLSAGAGPGAGPGAVPRAGATAGAAPASPRFVPLAPPVLEVDAVGYANLARDVRSLLGFDLGQYKAPQVWRRVNAFASVRGMRDVPTLLAACRTDAALKAAFRDMITINVSEFFRNAEAFETLRATFLADMVRNQPMTRVWSAGCSLGYEAWSLAMLVREQSSSAPIRILATDLDETILGQARASRYNETQMLGVSQARRARFFRKEGDLWEVRPEVKALVTFRRHDLLTDPSDGGYDLIACRNVVIYFTEEAKARLYQRFAGALRPGGILFLGATEAISNARAVGLEPVTPSFYRRPA